jgi:hypothetical protein
VADNPQETVRELQALVVAYAKQETLEPIKGLGRYLGLGLAAAVLMGTGIMFLEIGALRVLQDQTGTTFTGNWSWAPYAIVVVASVIVAALVWYARGRRTT